MTRWTMTANGVTVESIGGALPKQIGQIRKYVDRNNGLVPIEPYLSSIEYDERKPETVLAAARAWLEETAMMRPIVQLDGIEMPVYDDDDDSSTRVY